MVKQILATLALAAAYVFLSGFVKKIIKTFGRKNELSERRIIYVSKYFDGLLVVASLVVLSIVWSLDYKGLMVFASSLFAIVGVALFAQWSILSNITSGVIIFFIFPTKIGHKIKILDGENTIVGEIVEITLFQVMLRNSDGETVSYPNNLLLQKPLVLLNLPAKEERLPSQT